MATYWWVMTRVTCRLTAKNRDQFWNSMLGNRVWAPFTFFYKCYCRATCIILEERPAICWCTISLHWSLQSIEVFAQLLTRKEREDNAQQFIIIIIIIIIKGIYIAQVRKGHKCTILCEQEVVDWFSVSATVIVYGGWWRQFDHYQTLRPALFWSMF